MVNILRNPSTSEIIHAIEYNSYEHMKTMMYKYRDELQNLGFEFEVSEEYIKVYSGIPFPMTNGVLNTKLNSNTAENTINKIISYFKEKEVPFVWIVGPSSKPKNLDELLINNGLILVEKSPGMACNLKTLSNKIATDPHLNIKRVKNSKRMIEWTNVCLTASEWPKDLLFDLWFKINSPDNAFLAYYEGKPVATSYIFYGAGVAGIYDVCTLKEVRNKGIGTAISLEPLIQAKKLGYEFAILQSSEMGLNLYKNIGFKEYCTMETFVWNPN